MYLVVLFCHIKPQYIVVCGCKVMQIVFGKQSKYQNSTCIFKKNHM